MSQTQSKAQDAAIRSQAGLADVVAGNSSICFIDGQKGRLVYRGYDVAELCEVSTFRETAYLLWYGHLPTRAQFEPFSELFTGALQLPMETIMVLKLLPRRATPMEILRTGVSSLGNFDPDSGLTDPEAVQRKCTRLISRMMMLICASDCIRRGKDPIAPWEGKTLAYNFLYMRDGIPPSADAEQAMEVQLILHADHELNASTFAARVVASTMSDVYSAVTAAIGALKGPLHGGANKNVINLLDRIYSPQNAAPVVKDMLSRKQKVPGFGHRVYRTTDPRATVLRAHAEKLVKGNSDLERIYETALRVEEVVTTNTKVYPNVDFFSGIVYRAMGIPSDLFTPIFALSRAVGWTAHIQEQWADNRIIRPRAEYVGPMDQKYVPVEQRK
ncbi:MAG: citrate/2-methylcitrate synthase [Phycisphaerae bacterium]|nr:citrate/2-methylcitrate synthase [Phycisphaerae bacterium]